MRAERTRRNPRRRRLSRFWLYIEIIILAFLTISLGVVAGAFFSVVKMLPSAADIASYEPTEATKIYSSDGVLLADIYEENREVVPITAIPKNLQNATVAIEDARFYKHPGVDPQGIARALYQNLRRRHIAQGGSTLTQQLARNIYLSREKSFSRKLKEIILAVELERHFSKEQILELYMNQVYYGSGSYGVQTASTVYFGKDVKDLTLAQCALLAGLPQKPSVYSPYENLDAAVKRRNVVLDRMARLGYIAPAQRDEAQAEEVKLLGMRPAGIRRFRAPWFVTYVIKTLTEKYGADLVYRGGLTVHTTLNYEMQQAAEEALRNGVKEAKSRHVSQGALVCIDPQTGYIKAMVGGVNPDFTKDQYNRAVQSRRQPGSSFKAFVYTAAVDNGYDIYYRVSNKPITYKGKPWPKNYNPRQSASSYSMAQAVAQSVNRCAVNMCKQIGVDQVIMYARMLGIKSPIDPGLALALGASGVSVLELTSAYGVFAADGMRAEPMAIVRVNESDRGKDGALIEENRPILRQVLSEQTAQLMNELFRGVVTMGTGGRAGVIPKSHGKTGTTSEGRDAWWVGYTPELVAAVWVGNDDYSPMNRVWGGNVCCPTWVAFMRKALVVHQREIQEASTQQSESTVETPRERRSRQRETGASGDRATVTICAASGMLATRYCPTTYRVSFESGKEPVSYCTVHGPESNGQTPTQTPTETPREQPPPPPSQSTPGPPRPGTSGRTSPAYVDVTICVESGQIANEYCPETVARRFLASEAPARECRLHKER